MIKEKLFVALMVSLAFSRNCAAADGDDAMFGLKWGMSANAVRSLGTTMTKAKAEQSFETYRTNSLPKNISDTDYYLLVFADGKLEKLVAIGNDITNDPTGSHGKDRFDAVSTALTEKYGKPNLNYQSVGNALYKEYDEFYQCLAYGGCGMWGSTYESADKNVTIELKGLQRGSGYLVLTIESKPQWSDAMQASKIHKNSSDKDAL